MDEGIAGYVAYLSLSDSAYRECIQAWHELQFEIIRKAIGEGKWIAISGLSRENDWNTAEASSPGLAFAEAYVTVNYLVSKYGLDRCVAIYARVKDYGTIVGGAESALFSETGLTPGQLEVSIRDWLAAGAPN